jgi:cilia- and flagella-associated protein 57
MGLELEQYHKSNNALTLMIDELKLKLDGLRRESASQDERVQINSGLFEKMKTDLRDLTETRYAYF